ncbi:MAG TPA: MFS transporter [Chloroflexota bacterium]|jgi:FSR family fosmidomycin resistance protein-like MFS transporter|nr:MFS transporter [Chloroflexota bacterium]
MTTRPLLGAGTIAMAHAINDSYAYILPPLLPVLLTQAGITLTMGAALVAVQLLASSFLQPLFGHWADQSGGGRWMSWCGVLLSGLGAAALGVAPGFFGLSIAMLTTGIGTALFHPVSAALVAQAAPPNQRGFWMSTYISAGNLGLGLGPLLVGLVVIQGGLGGTWLLFLPAAAMAGLMWRLAPARPGRQSGQHTSLATVLRRYWRLLAVLVSIIAVRSWASTTLVTFLPTLATQRGASTSEAAQVLTVFLVAGAAGGFVGGAAADRVGRDRVVVGSLLLSVPFGVLLAIQDQFGIVFWLAALCSGFFLNGSWISLTVRGQESVPGSIAMMSGLMLGLSIGLGGLAVTPLGILAEHYGLAAILTAVALLPLLGAVMMRFVPHPTEQLPHLQAA